MSKFCTNYLLIAGYLEQFFFSLYEKLFYLLELF